MLNNQINNLEAIVGDRSIGTANLVIDSSNHIKNADIQVPGRSELKLTNPNIEKLNYAISDSAKVTLTGNTLHLFNK